MPACAVLLVMASCEFVAQSHAPPAAPSGHWSVSADAQAAHPETWLDLWSPAPRTLAQKALAAGGRIVFSRSF